MRARAILRAMTDSKDKATGSSKVQAWEQTLCVPSVPSINDTTCQVNKYTDTIDRKRKRKHTLWKVHLKKRNGGLTSIKQRVENVIIYYTCMKLQILFSHLRLLSTLVDKV